MLRNLTQGIGGILARPFREHLIFLIVFFILGTSPYCIKFIYNGASYYSFFLFMHCALISYTVALLVGLIQHKNTRRFVQILLIGISSILYILNIYCIFELHSLVDADYIMLILGTNYNEAKEFASGMVPLNIILGIISVFSSLILLWLFSKHHLVRFGKKWSIIALVFILICAMKEIYRWGIWEDGPIGHLKEMYITFHNYDIPDESQLKHELLNISYIENQEMPTNVVLIIGESFARFHSSLYGYDKLTNPNLKVLYDKSLLFCFDSISAPAPTTSISLQYMLTTFNREDNKRHITKWYEHPSVIELMKECGFDCYWFSNQARAGKLNYIARVFAESCIQSFFFQDEGPLDYNNRHDIVLADSSYQFVQKLNLQNRHNFIIYHMMGSHFDYSKRYSDEFNHFSENDYLKYPKNQREILATYDNSLLYNDYVVNQIINIFKDVETIILYVPDHGQDMFRSSPDYHTHGKMNDPVSYAYGIEIPFMIYASPSYQEKHPDVVERIKYCQSHTKAWNSENLPYLILDLIGVKEINHEDIRSKSVLN